MFNKLGYSVYVSNFPRQRQRLETLTGANSVIFTSFHIQEEFNKSYVASAVCMCRWLKEAGFGIMGDVSPKTLDRFGSPDILSFARDLGLDILRLDYGFPLKEILAVSRQFPIAFNASTVNLETARAIIASGSEVYAMHNFYPRQETGLDSCQFAEINHGLQHLGVKVLAFIPGDEDKRGPIHAGLPTVEEHRAIPPYVAFLDMAVNHGLDGIFVGDLGLSQTQFRMIQTFQETGAISIPADMAEPYRFLYNQVFTIRADSPLLVKRFQESREYSCPGQRIEPGDCGERKPGAITVDNYLYGRYSGEIQVLAKALPPDARVNRIGAVAAQYLGILNCLPNGSKVKLTKPAGS